jgi:hypothetical protein
LAGHFGGDRELADPTTALVGIPQTFNVDIYPATRVVTIGASVISDRLSVTSRRWALDDIEHPTASGERS